ncbi:MAG: LexA family protein [Limnothrix sp. BL-A-16]|jgi:DNA polymerase V
MTGRGGRRPGAGRPKGTGKYGEPTKAVRLPISFVDRLPELLAQWQLDQLETEAIADGRLQRIEDHPTPPLRLYEMPAAAGLHAFAPQEDTEPDAIDLNTYLSRHPNESFLVRVTGDSMIGIGIYPDDLLVIDASEADNAQTGQIVLALVDDKVTVKRLQVLDGRIFLHSENPIYAPLQITEGMVFKILGIVASAIHQFR